MVSHSDHDFMLVNLDMETFVPIRKLGDPYEQFNWLSYLIATPEQVEIVPEDDCVGHAGTAAINEGFRRSEQLVTAFGTWLKCRIICIEKRTDLPLKFLNEGEIEVFISRGIRSRTFFEFCHRNFTDISRPIGSC
ncbi:hypothetical protein M422DRAFT_271409 [Sphaerobolus stellatus SS14]|uniref:Unplaced genomic scaffold SPHSTscaffold_261, whole genome shotgun sequence n=1 Tax=Sphaerobolus stellatus (strain SS14) TaxID=990650 RepID=A0A0C9UPP6_SPHS4|nr:hypothetical protein M422DRAFT_271409 [Sphaerobolus stellatus SS14]